MNTVLITANSVAGIKASSRALQLMNDKEVDIERILQGDLCRTLSQLVLNTHLNFEGLSNNTKLRFESISISDIIKTDVHCFSALMF